MDINKISGYIGIGVLSAVLGYFGSQWIHTPKKAWITDTNADGIEDIVIESRDKKRAIVYGTTPKSKGENWEYISGDKANEIFNYRWREEYIKLEGKEPDSDDKVHLETKWEHW